MNVNPWTEGRGQQQEREPDEPDNPQDEVDPREDQRLGQGGVAGADELREEGEVEHGDLGIQQVA